MPRKIVVALPRMNNALKGGGHMHMVRFAQAAEAFVPTLIATYEQREEGYPYLWDIQAQLLEEEAIIVLSWGGSLDPLWEPFAKHHLVYFMKGQDFGDHIPPHVPIISNCQYLMAKAQQEWPHNVQYYLPEALEENCCNQGLDREIDVLFIQRKQDPYIINHLVPALKEKGLKVHVQSEFLPAKDLYGLYQKSKVYLYAFAPMRTDLHPSGYRWMEGSATQTLEAMACGCQVMSNFRGGMVDFLEPPLHGHKISAYHLEWDVAQVCREVNAFTKEAAQQRAQHIQHKYGPERYAQRLEKLIASLNFFFDFSKTQQFSEAFFTDYRPLTAWDKCKNWLYRLKRKWQ